YPRGGQWPAAQDARGAASFRRQPGGGPDRRGRGVLRHGRGWPQGSPDALLRALETPRGRQCEGAGRPAAGRFHHAHPARRQRRGAEDGRPAHPRLGGQAMAVVTSGVDVIEYEPGRPPAIQIDPITARVIAGALDSIALEVGHKLTRMSYSSIIRESEDFGVALLDAQG